MTKKKAALYSLVVAIFIGVLTAIGRKYIFPEWAARNEIPMLIIMGAIIGLVGPLIWQRGQRKK